MIKTLYLLILITSALSAAPNLSRNYTHRYFSTRDGLAQMQVMCAFQDSDGYMWFGTKGGVSRFDGVSFKNYTTENEFPVGQVNNICEWGARKLMFFARKIAVIYRNDSIVVYNIPAPLILTGQAHKTLPIDDENIFIFALVHQNAEKATDPSFNFIFNIRTKKFTQLTNFNLQVLRVIDNHIVTTTGLYTWNGKKFTLQLKFPFKVQDAIFDKKMENCALEKFQSNQLNLYKIENGKFISTSASIEGSVSRSSWLPDGSFLFLQIGAHQFFPARKVKLHQHLTFPNFSFIDKENNLWIGTENGLYNYFNLNIEEYNFIGIGV